jgi:HEAT repeat protein
VKRELQFALGSIGPDAAPAVGELIKSLTSDEELVRNSAIYALGKIGPAAKEALPALRKNLTGDDVPLKRLSLWAALKIDKGNAKLAVTAVPVLIAGLTHERDLVRFEAAVALGELGSTAKPAIDALKKATKDDSAMVREAATTALKNIQK